MIDQLTKPTITELRVQVEVRFPETKRLSDTRRNVREKCRVLLSILEESPHDFSELCREHEDNVLSLASALIQNAELAVEKDEKNIPQRKYDVNASYSGQRRKGIVGNEKPY
jgi:hypothetical protein